MDGATDGERVVGGLAVPHERGIEKQPALGYEKELEKELALAHEKELEKVLALAQEKGAEKAPILGHVRAAEVVHEMAAPVDWLQLEEGLLWVEETVCLAQQRRHQWWHHQSPIRLPAET